MAQFPPEEKLARIALARCPGIGPVLHARLLRRFGDGLAALRALPDLMARGRIRGDRVVCPEEAARELARAERLGARLLVLGEADYPARLAHLPDPPPVVALRGDIARLDGPAVAVVGARNASANGRAFARRMARELADAGILVISGLARGIDTAAHEGALEGAGGTAGILACGLDVAYPPENAALMEAIAANGLLLSERPFGEPPRATHFPRRNRLIAALSLAVVVVEAAERSGSLMTARLAAELGREVMAVPGTPLDPRHRGTNRLLREGAALVQGAADVLELLDGMVGALRPPSERSMGASGIAAAPAAPAETPSSTEAEPRSPLRERLESRLAPEPLAVDELVRQCQASAADVQEALLELELAGRITWHPGNRVSRTTG
ncbi:MAG TPA: DNA-protecting protein DprA [Rhodospirillales bacterium]|nr:DNA-protecting protein DprA [Rhodospirillales bacterium]